MQIHAGTLCKLSRLPVDKGLSRFGCVARQAVSFLGTQFAKLGQLDDSKWRARGERVERLAFDSDRFAGGEVLVDWVNEHRSAFERKSLGRSADAIDNRTLKQLAAGTDHHPPKPG